MSQGSGERADAGASASGDERLRAENARLRTANARLREVAVRQDAELDAARRQVGGLQARLEELAKRVAEQDQRIAAQDERIGELTARLGRDASNSSLPPSQEGLHKKPAKPRKPGGRRGKQPGAPGNHLAQGRRRRQVVEHAPEYCIRPFGRAHLANGRSFWGFLKRPS